MIREEYSIRLIRWWSIAEKSRRAAFVKKDGERNVSWVHWNGNTLAICRNTGKSFHRFPSSIRSEWHRNPVGLTPFSPDRTCLYLSLSLHSNGAEKHTREKGWQSFRGKFSSKWNIPVPSLALDPSELSSRRHRYIPSSIFPVYKVRELVADLLSKSFLENGEICSNSL